MSDEERLRIACRAASIGVWEWDLATNEMLYSQTARVICGFNLSDTITLEMVQAITHRDDIGRTFAQAARALDPKVRDTSEFIYRIVRADTREVRWVKAYGEAQFERVDGQERAVTYVGSIQDITEEKSKEDAVAESEAHLRLAIEAGQLAVWELDVGTDTITGSPELNRLYGFPEDSTPTTDEFRSRYAPGERERTSKIAEKVLSDGGTQLNLDIRHLWPDGTEKWLLMRAEVGLNRQGDGLRVIGVVADISELKTHEQRLATTARELRHRLMNTISVISALASRSWPAGFSEAKTAFQTRLQAIGKATDLMFPRSDASSPATLVRLLRDITDAYRSEEHDPFLFQGPDVTVDEHLRPLAMAFHELSTNALKYGALSTPEGKVLVSWKVEADGALQIDWQERDGPPVAPPESFGLGSTLLTKMLFTQPHRVDIRYDQDGVQCRISLRG